jgi:hypothetical protein
MKKWKFFLGASVVAVWLLVNAGAPPVSIALGLLLGAGFTWWADRRNNRVGRDNGAAR